MTLPTLDKTYQFNVNQGVAPLGSALANNRRMIRTCVKDALVGFGTNPWTVIGSSNSVAAAMDGVDRWAADANLVWAAAGVAHSWIVLRQTGIATNYEICIDLTNASATGTVMSVNMSPSAGFTGGSTTSRPTAVDETIVTGNAAYGGVATDISSRTHVIQSTDGQVTYVVFSNNNVGTGFWQFSKAKNPVSGWTNPSITTVTTALNGAANTRGRGVSNMVLFLTSEAYNGNPVGVAQIVANELNGEYPMLPIGVASDTTSNRGRHGQVFDLWWGLSVLADGDTYPNDATRQFCQFGDLILPWNGSTPQLS